MDGLAAFSPSYVVARQQFRKAAAELGWQLEAHLLGLPGPEGEPLTVDVAISPAKRADKALILSSGLHGVEGFFGSAVQVALLRQWQTGFPSVPDLRCIFIHGLNPFGFAWLRRCDQDNNDPNRNFLLEGEEYSGSPPGYAKLDPLLNPDRPPSRWSPFTLMALLAIARHGMPMLMQTVAAGQHDFPRGLFYGGAKPSRLHLLLAEHLNRWIQDSQDIVHLDFHTGLGAWATGQLLLDYVPQDRQRRRMTDWFGAEAFEAGDAHTVAYSARGCLGRWCVEANRGREYLYACAEFGTYGPVGVLGALRAENQAHHWGQPASRSTQRAKQRLQEVFCPKSPTWRRKALDRSFDFVRQVLVGFQQSVAVVHSR